MEIDAFELARTSGLCAGAVGLAALSRIEMVDRNGELDWSLRGVTSKDGNPFLELSVQGSIRQVCQRCLKPVELAVHVNGAYELVRSQEAVDAASLEEDAYDVILGAVNFDVMRFVEDEVILALPIVARHEQCDAPIALVDPQAKENSPFAVLEALKPSGK